MNSEPLNFVDIDVEKLRSDAITEAESRLGESLYAGDERRIFTDVIIYVLAWFVALVNKMCRGRLLGYASGYQLDALGERVNCTRLAPVPARTRLKFTLETVRPNDITIPAGTTVTSDNKVLFATDASAVIKAGKTEVTDVAATATTGGVVTNGIPVGAIQSFVDRVPFVTGVFNTVESSGGDDGEPYPIAIDPDGGDNGEGDDRYRERIKLAPAAWSAAGSAASYEYHARSASGNIESVAVTSDQEAGTVDIYVTEKGGVLPTQGTIDAVTAAVTRDDIRPLNDKVTVQSPTEVQYDIELTYYVLQENESAAQKAIEGVGGAIEQYNAWQQANIGRDVNPDRLRAFLLDHCVRVDLVQPTYQAIANSELARFSGSLNISHTVVSE